MNTKIKKIVLVFLAMSVIAFLIAIIKDKFSNDKPKTIIKNQSTETTTAPKVDMDNYYSYADVKDSISYLYNSEDDGKAISRLVDVLNMSDPINVGYIKELCDIIKVPYSVYNQTLADMSDTDYVTKQQYEEIYSRIEQSGAIKGLDRFDVFVYDVVTNTDDKNVSSDWIFDGSKSYKLNIDLPDEFKDKIIDVYAKNGAIFRINGYGNSSFEFKNVWVKSQDASNCKFLFEDRVKVYNMSTSASVTDSSKTKCDFVASITVDNSGVISVKKQNKGFKDHISKIKDNKFITDKHGELEIADDIKIYNIYGDVRCENSLDNLSGYKKLKLIKDEDKKVSAVIINDELISENIRVIICNDDFSSYDLESVTVTSDGPYIIEYPDETKDSCEAGSSFTVYPTNFKPGDRIRIIPDKKDGRIELLSVNRECGNPYYSGIIEIQIFEENLHVINELKIEDYLYSVVSAEMPSDYDIEALKAVAVCCRGYAYSKVHDGSFAEYDAHLDDSSMCQSYNNVLIDKYAQKAVKDTYGMIMTYNNTVVSPLYYQTSCGMTATNAEIWGGEAYEYYSTTVESSKREELDLSDENKFRDFINNEHDYEIIDKESPYYRWKIEFSKEEISNAINSMLAERVNVNASNILVKNGEEFVIDDTIKSVGTVSKISVEERTKSGVVSTLIIEGSEATIKVVGQSNIRNLITPVAVDIVRQDDSVVTNWTSLPSPFYYVDEKDGKFIVNGGGFGHGVGLSKSGAQILAKNGNEYRYILKKFFSGVELTSIYNTDQATEADDANDNSTEAN